MGRDVPAISVSQQDRRAYREKVRRCLDVFARMLRESRFETEPRQVGLEIELNLVDEAGLPSMKNTEVLGAIADPSWASELGQFNLEINVPPRPLAGDALTRLERGVRASLDHADGRARQAGSHLVHDRHPAHAARERRRRAGHVGEPAVPAAERADLRRPRRGDADLDRGRRAAAHPHRHDHPGGRLHQRAVPPPGQPGGVRQLLERRPGDRGRAGGRRRQLPVPVRPGTVAGDQAHAVRAGHRHQAGRAQGAGGPAPGVVRRALDHLGVRPVRGEPAVLPRAAAAVRGRGPGRRAGPRAGTRSSPS